LNLQQPCFEFYPSFASKKSFISYSLSFEFSILSNFKPNFADIYSISATVLYTTVAIFYKEFDFISLEPKSVHD